MDRSSGVATLGRALVSLERRLASGRLLVTTGDRRELITVCAGSIVGLDALSHAGGRGGGAVVEPTSHQRWGLDAPMGLQARLVWLMTRGPLDYRYVAGNAVEGRAGTGAPLVPSAVILNAVRKLALRGCDRESVVGLPDDAVELTAFGRAIVGSSELNSSELPLRGMTARSFRPRQCADALQGDPAARTLLFGLQSIGGFRRFGSEAFPLLLKKRRQVRRSQDPFQLLDLPPSAGVQDARRALRRIARVIHPDCIARHGDPIEDVSNQVMGELLEAERRIRHLRADLSR